MRLSIHGLLVAALAASFADPVVVAQETKPAATVKLDRHGDPLPMGAVDRLGSIRLRHPQVSSIALSPDGRTLVSLGHAELRFWDIATGKLRHEEKWTGGGGRCRFSSDGSLLAVGSSGHEAVFWDAVNAKELRRFQGRFLGFAPDDTLRPGGKLRVLDIDVAIPEAAIPRDAPKHVWGNRSPQGKWYVLSEAIGRFRIWDVEAKKDVATLEPKGARTEDHFCALRFAPNDESIVIAWSSEVVVWDLTRQRQRFALPIKQLYAVAIAPDSKRMALAMIDGAIGVFDLESGRELRRWPTGCGGTLEYSPDGKNLASTSGASIRLWNAETGARTDPFGDFDSEPRSIRFSPDGRTIAVDSDESIRILDVEGFRVRQRIDRIRMRGTSALFSPDSRTLGYMAIERFASSEMSVRTVDVATGKEKHVLRQEGYSSMQLSFGRPGLRFHARDEAQLATFDGVSGNKLHGPIKVQVVELEGPEPVISGDGKSLAEIEGEIRESGHVVLRDPMSGARRLVLGVPKDAPFRDERSQLVLLGFSDNGRSFLAGSGEVRDFFDDSAPRFTELLFWETATGTLRARWKSGPAAFTAHALSADGRVFAAATGNVVRAWDPVAGKELALFQGHDCRIVALGISPDGTSLISGCSDATLTMWRVPVPTAAAGDKLGDERLKQLWADLEVADGARAYQAIGTMSRYPRESLPYLRDRLPHGPPADAKIVAGLIADLGNDDFGIREKATGQLAGLGYRARTALQSAADATASPEVRQRLRSLLRRFDSTTTEKERTRVLRAIEMLERVGTAEARDALRDVQTFSNRELGEEAGEAADRVALRLPMR